MAHAPGVWNQCLRRSEERAGQTLTPAFPDTGALWDDRRLREDLTYHKHHQATKNPMNGLVTVSTFRDILDAQAALAKLESEGFECSLANEHLVGALWTYSTAVGGVQLQVPSDQAEAAATVLAADESNLLAQIENESSSGEAEDVCPYCGSTSLATIRLQRYAAAVTLLIPLPLFIFGTRVKCRACGRRWKPKAS